MSVYSCVSPAMAALRFRPVSPIGSPAFSRRAEHGGDVVIAFDVGLLREVEIATVRLAFAGKGVFQILLGLRAFELRHGALPRDLVP
jgi:hypothetical protein